MSLEHALAANTESLNTLAALMSENNELSRQIIAGRTEAIAQLAATGAAAGATTTERKPRASKTTPPATTETPPAGDTPKTTTAAAEKKAPPIPTIEELRPLAAGWIGCDEDKEKRAERMANLKAMNQHFGVNLLTEIPEDRRIEAKFFIERFKLNLPVDFSADYDFAGAPDQGAHAPAADEFDDGIG